MKEKETMLEEDYYKYLIQSNLDFSVILKLSIQFSIDYAMEVTNILLASISIHM